MPRQVDFYLLESQDEQSRLKTLCRLAEKVQRMGHTILVLTMNNEQSKMLDALMWTFSQSSFLPHAVADSAAIHYDQSPVMIHHELPQEVPQVLINLKDDIPETENLQRVVEIVNQQTQVKSSGRKKYRDYKIQQYSIKTHHLHA